MTSPIINYDIWRRDIILAPALISHGAGAIQCRDVADSVDSQSTGLLPLVCSFFEEGYCVVASSGHGVVAAVAVVTRLWQGLWQQWATAAATPASCQLPCVGPGHPDPHFTVLYRYGVRAVGLYKWRCPLITSRFRSRIISRTQNMYWKWICLSNF